MHRRACATPRRRAKGVTEPRHGSSGAQILGGAERVDAAEDDAFGDRRGDELPERWADRRDRRARLREALRQLDAQGAADWETYMAQRSAKEAAAGRKLPGRKPAADSKTPRRCLRPLTPATGAPTTPQRLTCTFASDARRCLLGGTRTPNLLIHSHLGYPILSNRISWKS
jgi:hypothetical protein